MHAPPPSPPRVRTPPGGPGLARAIPPAPRFPAAAHPDAPGWRRYADTLAAWALGALVNRADVWGAYIPPASRATPDRKSWTAPRLAERGRVLLEAPTLARHFAGAAVVGLHTTAPDGTSRWGAFDVDAHAVGDREAPARNRAAVGRLVAVLGAVGVTPLVEASCDRGGFHVWCLFDALAPTPQVYAFLHAVREAAGLAPADVETFPKQPAPDRGGVGNWLRLPGPHHTRPVWSRLWPVDVPFVGSDTAPTSARWLAGADAARELLAAPRHPAAALPPVSPVVAPPPAPHARWTLGAGRADGDVWRRVQAYVTRVDHGLADGRKTTAYRLAAALAHDFGLGADDVHRIVAAWNADNVPPLGDAQLAGIVTSARRYGGRRARGAA